MPAIFDVLSRRAFTRSPGIYSQGISTADGLFMAHFSDRGLIQLDFPERARIPESTLKLPSQVQEWVSVTKSALTAALWGRQSPALPQFDLSSGTDFQQRVWQILLATHPGQTVSYSALAAAAGRPGAARAAGQACGANPIPVLIPCHRVLAANGGLGGFSGGLQWKQKLLERECQGLALSPARACA